MTNYRKPVFLSLILFLFSPQIFAQTGVVKPVTPNASPEAKALLQLIYNVSGKYTLTGQHNFPASKDINSVFAGEYSGKKPAIWSTDFGFAKEGDKDSHLLRADLVKEAIRQNQLGSIITICWHAVPPTADEPVTFQPLPGADPNALASVQGRLTDQQFKDILTPGTQLNKKWMAQVDTIAYYLKQLQKAHVPVLWRPYHEMNGSWFWWGGRGGKDGTQAIYRQIFDRLVHYHKINNLVWVWNVDRPNKREMAFTNFYPGNKYLDILALDVYGSDFKQDYYDGLLALSQGKPIAFGEVGNPPTSEILKQQPKWCYWVIWAGMVRNTSKKQYAELYNDPRMLGLDDPDYINLVNPLRATLGLPLLSLNKPADFTGEWVLNEDKSKLGDAGGGNTAVKLKVTQSGSQLDVQKTVVEEWDGEHLSEEKIMIDGTQVNSTFMNSPRVTTATLSANADSLFIKSKTTMNYGGQSREMISTENWSLQNHGKELAITQTSTGRGGEKTVTMVYDKW